MKILITGGAGFIGSNAARYFSDSGHRVWVFDNFSRDSSHANARWLADACPSVRVLSGDLRKTEEVCSAFRDVKPDWVLHLGAQVAVTTSVSSPREDFEINALGTLNVLEAMRALRPEARLIFSSTNKVYGALDELDIVEEELRMSANGLSGISETFALDFFSPYGCSKGAADQYVIDYGRIYGLETMSIRQSCIYGPRQFGVEDQGWLSWFALRAIRGQPVSVYGTGKQVRDLLYVEDLLDLYNLAFTSATWPGGAVNAGGGLSNSLSLLEYLSILEVQFDLGLKYYFEVSRPGDQIWFVSDNSKANDVLGWRPSTDVEKGLNNLIGWSRSII